MHIPIILLAQDLFMTTNQQSRIALLSGSLLCTLWLQISAQRERLVQCQRRRQEFDVKRKSATPSSQSTTPACLRTTFTVTARSACGTRFVWIVFARAGKLQGVTHFYTHDKSHTPLTKTHPPSHRTNGRQRLRDGEIYAVISFIYPIRYYTIYTTILYSIGVEMIGVYNYVYKYVYTS